MPFAPLARIGVGEEHDVIGDRRVGDEGLLARETPPVAVAHRDGLQRGDVGAGLGLGEPERGDRTAGERVGEPTSLFAPRCRTREMGQVPRPCTAKSESAEPLAQPSASRTRQSARTSTPVAGAKSRQRPPSAERGDDRGERRRVVARQRPRSRATSLRPTTARARVGELLVMRLEEERQIVARERRPPRRSDGVDRSRRSLRRSLEARRRLLHVAPRTRS